MFRPSFKCTYNISRIISTKSSLSVISKPAAVACAFSTEIVGKSSSFFKTSETNPVNLNERHLGRFYCIDKEAYQKLYVQYHGFTPEYREQCKTFREQCYLVRKPYLDLKNCVDALDLQKPVVRFIIFGDQGVGKAMTMAGMVHYAYVREFVLVCQPWIPLWSRWTKDKLVPSSVRPEYFNHTIEAVAWLANFKTQNAELIEKLNLVTGKDYHWSQREATLAGAPLMKIADHGISRPAHAADCILAIIQELKELSSQQKCKTMVFIGGVNGMYFDNHKHVTSDKKVIPHNRITTYEAMKEICKADWTGGVVITTVDTNCEKLDRRESTLPRYLLTKEGWELLDPFIPIEVSKYTSQEVQTTLDYFIERKWLAHPRAKTEEGRLEIEYLSTRNPETLMQICCSR